MSKTSFFNTTLFTKNLKRFWPIWSSYFAIWFLFLPMVLLNIPGNRFDNLLYSYILYGIIIGFIYSAICAMALFSYMYSSKSAGMFHALPMTRQTMFITNYLSGLVYMLAPNLIIALLLIPIGAARGDLDMISVLTWLGVVSGTEFFFFSFAAFCGQFTGVLVALPVFYLIWNFAVYVLELVVSCFMELLVWGYTPFDWNGLSFLSPVIYMLQTYETNYVGTTDSYVFINGHITVWYVMAGVVLAVLSLLLYKNRRVESAGDVISVKAARPVFRWGVALYVSLLLTLLVAAMFDIRIDSTPLAFPLTALSLVVTGFIGWFVAEMLMKKSFRVFNRKNLGSFAAFVVIALLCVTVTAFDVLGIESHIPDREDIEFICISGTDFTTEEDIDAAIAFHQQILDSKDQLLATDQGYEGYFSSGEDYSYLQSIYMCYYLKNGDCVARYYNLPVDPQTQADSSSLANQYEQLVNSGDKIIQRTFGQPLTKERLSSVSIGFYNEDNWSQITLSGDEAWLLAQAVCADLVEMNMNSNSIFPETNSILDNEITINYYPKEIKEDGVPVYTQTEGSHQVSYGASFNLTDACVYTIAAIEQLDLLDDQHQLTPY